MLIYVEVGKKRAFASALEWYGWTRSARDADAAIEALRSYAPRYAEVAREARLKLPGEFEFEVLETVTGDATTDFGAPGQPAAWDSRPFARGEAKRMVALLEASWRVFARIAASAPAQLRKGPRGGGRDRDKIVEHVEGAEESYARKLGVKKATRPQIAEAVLRAAREGAPDAKWPARYLVRRTAWHALDHAWEIEDRSP